MFTDGVADNLFESKSLLVKNEELIQRVLDICVLPFLEGETLKDPKRCAECIADLARAVYKYPKKMTEFEYPEEGDQADQEEDGYLE